jgi:hypothetical protein
MKTHGSTTTVRRSVALSRLLVEEVTAGFVARRKARAFRQEMAAMAADSAVRAENGAIMREFAIAEGDGLPDD